MLRTRLRRLLTSTAAGLLIAGTATAVGIATPSPAHAVGTPTFSINNQTITELDNGVGLMTFTITLANGVPGGSTVQYSFNDAPTNTATAGTNNCSTGFDYLSTAQTAVTLTNTTTTATVNVPWCGDTIDEPNETFQIILSDVSFGAQIDAAAGVGIGTILDDDSAPTLTVPNRTFPEPSTGSSVSTVPISLTNASGSPISLNWSTAAGTATEGAVCNGTTVDYLQSSGTLQIPADSTTPSVPITVPICADNVSDGGQTFTLHFTSPVGTFTAPAGNTTITISQGGGGGGGSRSIVVSNAPSFSEASGGVAFDVDLTGTGAHAAITMQFKTVDLAAPNAKGGTACGTNVDYLSFTNKTVVMAAGVNHVQVTVQYCNDTIDENTESYQLQLVSQTSAFPVTKATATAGILDDDAAPTVSITASTQKLEGNSGSTRPLLLATLTAAGALTTSGKTITLDFDTQDIAGGAISGTCGVAGVDYQSQHRTVTINPGRKFALITQSFCGDTLVEAAEQYNYAISHVVNATPGTTSGAATILNDDGAAVTIANRSTTEGNTIGGSHTVAMTLTFPTFTPAAGTIRYTMSGTAVRSSSSCTGASNPDYVAKSPATKGFAAGVKTVTLLFTVCEDQQWELDETASIGISNIDWFGVPAASAVLTIVNDDPFPG